VGIVVDNFEQAMIAASAHGEDMDGPWHLATTHGSLRAASGWWLPNDPRAAADRAQSRAADRCDDGTHAHADDTLSQSIEQALGLSSNQSLAEIGAVRRQFARHNHPDRLPPSKQKIATRRMQIANQILDEATRKATGAARSPPDQ
jgi:hypothetical protein